MYQPNCPHCLERVESQSGFYTESNGVYTKNTLNTRLLTRVAINRQRKVAEDELLYHLTAVDPLSTDGKEVYLQGTMKVPSALTNKVADTLQKKVKRLGGGSSRGLGKVSLKVEKYEVQDTLKQRIDKFNCALQETWNNYFQLSNVGIGAFDGIYFSVNLQSDAILTAEDGWQRSMVITAPMLKQMTGCGTESDLHPKFCELRLCWWVECGMGGYRKRRTLSRKWEASLFFIHLILRRGFLPCRHSKITASGDRREEGFGQITICDAFHLRSRGQVKSEGAWLQNEEETR